jgi:hypothetical protein
MFMSMLNMDTVPVTAVDKVMVIDKEMDTDSDKDADWRQQQLAGS